MVDRRTRFKNEFKMDEPRRKGRVQLILPLTGSEEKEVSRIVVRLCGV